MIAFLVVLALTVDALLIGFRAALRREIDRSGKARASALSPEPRAQQLRPTDLDLVGWSQGGRAGMAARSLRFPVIMVAALVLMTPFVEARSSDENGPSETSTQPSAPSSRDALELRLLVLSLQERVDQLETALKERGSWERPVDSAQIEARQLAPGRAASSDRSTDVHRRDGQRGVPAAAALAAAEGPRDLLRFAATDVSSAVPNDAHGHGALEQSLDTTIVGSSTSALAPPTMAGAPTQEPDGSPRTLSQAAPPTSVTTKTEPFAFGDFTWLTGNSRQKDAPLDTKAFSPEVRVDVNYIHDFNHPADNTIAGSSEVFRSGEFQLTQLGVGGDFHYANVRARLLTQFGMYSQTTPRNDASPGRGQWNLDSAYRYISEAYGGYHVDKLNGINIDAGIFMSYVGLFSYYQYDNWAYQPSYVSSNTPWFFNGVRVQIFPSDKLKIEPWLINGWQSYGKFNKAPGLGMQVLWRPNSSLSILGNQYWGTDTLGTPDRKRVHTDDSIQVKYYDHPEKALSKAAFTLTFDAGCEYGGGVSCSGGSASAPSQYFLGFMVYNRFWFHRDLFGLTLGGGAITNPGRYLVLLPPINGATAFSGTPYFTGNPGDPYKAWDYSVTFDYMPAQFVTFRSEFNHRAASVPYFAGVGGVTPPGGNTGPPGSLVPGWAPDLRKDENRLNFSLLVKF